MSEPKDTRELLRAQLDVARWKDLRPHAERGALIVVQPELELVKVGMAVTEDQAQLVQEWLGQNQVGRPTPDQLRTWGSTPERSFDFLIVQPYVLIQERSH